MTTVTVSLVIETHNLHGGDAEAQHVALDRVLRHLAPQLAARSERTEVVLTHEGPAPRDLDALERALGTSIRLAPMRDGSTYYDAKNRGFEASSGAIVVFADSDCWPLDGWLDGLLAPFADEGVCVVAGRTRYRDDTLGRAVSLLDFLYVTRAAGDHVLTRNFYANNVAFRRAAFAAHHYREDEPFFRGHCQVLGLELAEAGVAITFADDAVTIHRFPDRIAELLELRLRRGRDLAHLAPRITAHAGLPIPSGLATAATWLARQAIAHQTLHASDLTPLARAKVEAVSLAVAALDGVGSMFPHRPSDDRALGYVTDRDGLAFG
jgi:hypothetical protein